ARSAGGRDGARSPASVRRARRSVVCFFFSSRRRHTRSKRDWSSDVCSSDLGDISDYIAKFGDEAFKHVETLAANTPVWSAKEQRSEERRVGKERRSRGSPERSEK